MQTAPSRPCALVWFKRDLRLADHAPLAAAAAFPSAFALFIVEPEWLHAPECDPQHVQFARAGVQALQAALAQRGLPLLVRVGEAVAVLDALQRQTGFTHLLSHEETGPGWSYARDRRVAAWCRARGVVWQEWPQTGVVRRLKSRDGWVALWQRRMDAPQVSTPAHFTAPRAVLDLGEFPSLAELGLPAARPTPAAGEAAAWQTLQSFLSARGNSYRFNLSSPLRAEQGCSRLSAYLAFGMIGMRQVYQATTQRIAELRAQDTPQAKRFAHHLDAFAARLRWHCHFMQKLEDEPEIEFRNFARAYDSLRDPEPDSRLFAAWCEGRTGYPMVDACMRCLNATGWINFPGELCRLPPLVALARTRAALGTPIPRLRGRYPLEPDADAIGHYRHQHAAHLLTHQAAARSRPTRGVYPPLAARMGHTRLPTAVVDERAALARAKERLYALRRSPEARAEADAVQQRHGSRKSGLPQVKRPRRRAATPLPAQQLELFE